MGQARSKENRALAKKTHFSPKEINHLRQNLEATSATKSDKASITEDVFTQTVKKYVPSVSPNDEVFLKRLYAAFDVHNNKSIDFGEFVDGLSVFMKGNPDEKLALSFKLYDADHDNYLTKTELERVMLQLSHAFSEEDRTNEIKTIVSRMFDDLDVDNDGKLSFEEYRLSAMKEPLIVDFLEQFLAEHNLSNQPRPPSRPPSVRSYRSGRSLTPIGGYHRSPGSPTGHQSRLSVRLSQAELLDYSHHQQRLNSVPTSPTSSSHSPRSTATSGAPPSPIRSNSPVVGAHSSRSNHGRLSRGTSMTSLDAALTSMDMELVQDAEKKHVENSAVNNSA
ncbi:hypothetical protein DFQ28_000866 [Apophysomyces sp. BC1034]|nr:hypothetical protein DFQ30_000843 [Apophysomyces sp. BC1015]KAG0181741.1 hypothetical protein DFQ29_007286 [Apophysomyces sp. BC1021]KAG0191118.1 hypothetical protein DFQ28_000866 [Apophysomyces sp. BC1034]